MSRILPVGTTMFFLAVILITIKRTGLLPWGWANPILPISVLLTMGVTTVMSHSIMSLILWGSNHQSRS